MTVTGDAVGPELNAELRGVLSRHTGGTYAGAAWSSVRADFRYSDVPVARQAANVLRAHIELPLGPVGLGDPPASFRGLTFGVYPLDKAPGGPRYATVAALMRARRFRLVTGGGEALAQVGGVVLLLAILGIVEETGPALTTPGVERPPIVKARAMALSRLGRLDEAIACLDAETPEDPEDLLQMRGLAASLLCSAARHAEGLARLEPFLERFGEVGEVGEREVGTFHAQLAAARWADGAGDAAAARAHLTRCFAAWPGQPTALHLLLKIDGLRSADTAYMRVTVDAPSPDQDDRRRVVAYLVAASDEDQARTFMAVVDPAGVVRKIERAQPAPGELQGVHEVVAEMDLPA